MRSTPSEPSLPGRDGEVREQHDATGRGRGPYVPPGRDEEGRLAPSVPHEGLLGRLGTAILLGQSAVLAAVAVAGLVTSTTWTAPSPVEVLGLGMNVAHAVLLAATAVAGAVVCLRRRAMRYWAVTQFALYMVIFLAGTTLSANTLDRSGLNLNGPDHLLHGVLALLGFVVAMLTSARIVEPPPAPAPNADETRSDSEPGQA